MLGYSEWRLSSEVSRPTLSMHFSFYTQVQPVCSITTSQLHHPNSINKTTNPINLTWKHLS